MDPAILLFAALLLDALAGDMPALFRRVPHPVVLVGRLVAWLERRLNRPYRGRRDRRVRGAVTTVLILALATGCGWGVQALLGEAGLFGALAEVLVIAVLVAQRSLFDHVRAVALALRRNGLAAGQAAVGHIVGRDVTRLDAHGVARAAIESLAENFSDAVVAPAFWYLLLGLPGLFLYKTANTLDSMIGHRDERFADYGMVAARLDDVLNLIPARVAGLCLALAAPGAPSGRLVRALRVMWRDARKHASPNAGWPEGAMAGGLGLALGGPRRYAGGVSQNAWIGEGRATVTVPDIHRALIVYVGACLVHAALVAVVFLLGGGPSSLLSLAQFLESYLGTYLAPFLSWVPG